MLYRANLVPLVPVGQIRLTAISKHSVSGCADFDIYPLQRLMLDFGPVGCKMIAIASCEGGYLSARFEEPWPLLPTALNALARSGMRGWRLRSPPVPELIVPAALAGVGSVVIVRDLCGSGAMIETSRALIADQSVVIFLGSGQAVPAQVRWTKNGRAGLRFCRSARSKRANGTGEQVQDKTAAHFSATVAHDSEKIELDALVMTAAQICSAPAGCCQSNANWSPLSKGRASGRCASGSERMPLSQGG